MNGIDYWASQNTKECLIIHLQVEKSKKSSKSISEIKINMGTLKNERLKCIFFEAKRTCNVARDVFVLTFFAMLKYENINGRTKGKDLSNLQVAQT